MTDGASTRSGSGDGDPVVKPTPDLGSEELWSRYAPGEELGPLLRALGGGALGGLVALTIDWVIATGLGVSWMWPSVASAAAKGSSTDLLLGVILTLAAATAAALVFVFGQFRRFVPGPGYVGGVIWGVVVWFAAAPLLLPHWVNLERTTDAPAAVLALAGLAVGQSLVAALAYGLVVGWLNPRGEVDPPTR